MRKFFNNDIPACTGAIVSVGNGTSPIFLDSLQCIGTETSLVDCADELRPVGITNCQKDNVVIVQCAGIVIIHVLLTVFIFLSDLCLKHHQNLCQNFDCTKHNYVTSFNTTDLNECASGDPCPGEGALCQNSFMNYTCGCAQGYVLTDNGTCVSTGISLPMKTDKG